MDRLDTMGEFPCALPNVCLMSEKTLRTCSSWESPLPFRLQSSHVPLLGGFSPSVFFFIIFKTIVLKGKAQYLPLNLGARRFLFRDPLAPHSKPARASYKYTPVCLRRVKPPGIFPVREYFCFPTATCDIIASTAASSDFPNA